MDNKLKNPRDRKPRSGSTKPDKSRGSFVKKGKVWRTDKAQETARGSTSRGPSRGSSSRGYSRESQKPHPPRPTSDEDSRLQAQALSGTGPGGYAKFGDIPAHKSGRSLRGELYKIANGLPDDERGNLASRIKHAATTITASLATGFGEGTFRSGITRALESRGALQAIQDLLDQVVEQQMAEADTVSELKQAVEKTVQAVNEYLGRLAKEREKNRTS